MSTTVQLDKQGALVLPPQVREKHQMREGDTLQLVDLDGMLLLTRLSPVVPELARQIEQVRQEAGLSIEELLVSLRKERTQKWP